MSLTETRLEKIANHVPGVVFQFQLWPDGRSAFPYSSRGIEAIYGVTPEQVSEDAAPVFAVLHPDDFDSIVDSINTSAEQLSIWHHRYRVNHPNGKTIWVEGESMPERQGDGSTLWHGYIRDITKLYEAQQRLELVVDSTAVGIWDWDVQTGETVFNERWANIIGYTLAELSPVNINTWLEYAYDEDLPGSEAALKACWAGESEYYIFESRMHHKDGSLVWVYDTGKVVEWLEPGVPKRMIGTHLDITARKKEQAELREAKKAADRAIGEMVELNSNLQAEISQRKEVERQLQQMALYDYLTNLPNRGYLKDYVKKVFSEARRGNLLVAIVFIDLDGFKVFNDNFGHDIGDAVLVEMSSRLSDSVRDMDLIARLGGDEFLAVLPGCKSRVDIDTIAQRILDSTKEPFDFIENSPTLGLSIGIAVYPEDGESFEELLSNADKAMYTSKASKEERPDYRSH